MNINITLLGQMITFAIFVFITMKYVWPPIISALDERRKTITEGLEAGERGKHELDLAQKNIADKLRESKKDAAVIIEEANRRGVKIVDDAKDVARQEATRIKDMAQVDIQKEVQTAKEALASEISTIALGAVEKVLRQSVDKETNKRLIEELIEEI